MANKQYHKGILLAQEEVPLEYNIPPPIWVIDEANMFSQLEGSEEFAYSTCNPYIVGDLSKKEAEEYFEKHVLPRYGCKELEGKFDRVRRITGTRMMIIDKYVKEYKNCEGELEYSDLIKTMEAIVKAEDQGYILEDNLIEEIGFDQVNNSLVDYNFFTVDQPHDLLMILTHQMKQF
ncbi:4036_t:CDS:2 [Rhizophagus irregularis]|nr:4036_t:CDS:2 [Rhizophagus irregularis]